MAMVAEIKRTISIGSGETGGRRIRSENRVRKDRGDVHVYAARTPRTMRISNNPESARCIGFLIRVPRR